jgi:hypothetical protein
MILLRSLIERPPPVDMPKGRPSLLAYQDLFPGAHDPAWRSAPRFAGRRGILIALNPAQAGLRDLVAANLFAIPRFRGNDV